jgi:hypothetical protein
MVTIKIIIPVRLTNERVSICPHILERCGEENRDFRKYLILRYNPLNK